MNPFKLIVLDIDGTLSETHPVTGSIPDWEAAVTKRHPKASAWALNAIPRLLENYPDAKLLVLTARRSSQALRGVTEKFLLESFPELIARGAILSMQPESSYSLWQSLGGCCITWGRLNKLRRLSRYRENNQGRMLLVDDDFRMAVSCVNPDDSFYWAGFRPETFPE